MLRSTCDHYRRAYRDDNRCRSDICNERQYFHTILLQSSTGCGLHIQQVARALGVCRHIVDHGVLLLYKSYPITDINYINEYCQVTADTAASMLFTV